MRTIKLGLGVWLAGFVAGALALYLGGPAVGVQLRTTGQRLAGLDGDTGFTTAAEARDVVEALAEEAVNKRARVLLPASIVRR